MKENADTKNTTQSTKPAKWFWIISSIALIWNLLGLLAFGSQMSMNTSSLPEAQRLFYETTPVWATFAFAIAVGCGVLGCIALLFRRTLAVQLFTASLIGLLIQMSHSLLLSDGLKVFGSAGLIMPVVTFAIAALLIAFALRSKKRGWLNS